MSEWILRGEQHFNHVTDVDQNGDPDPDSLIHNRFYDFRAAEYTTPEGNDVRYIGSVIRECVHVVAVEDDETTYLVRQARPNVRQPGELVVPTTIELPGGFSTKGLTLAESANKELGQEVYRHAGSLEEIMRIYPSTGISSETDVVFLGTELVDDPNNPRDEATELSMKVISGPFMELYGGLAESRDPVSGQTFAAMTKAAIHLGFLAPRGRKTL